jgi:hypothetical protein
MTNKLLYEFLSPASRLINRKSYNRKKFRAVFRFFLFARFFADGTRRMDTLRATKFDPYVTYIGIRDASASIWPTLTATYDYFEPALQVLEFISILVDLFLIVKKSTD